MNIAKKITEIQKSPYHIRIRYVFGCVFISMSFIFLLWIFSLQTLFSNDTFVNTPRHNTASSQQIQTQEKPETKPKSTLEGLTPLDLPTHSQ